MYLVLKIMNKISFLDTFSMGVTHSFHFALDNVTDEIVDL
jgi:hypothetical protein